MTSLREKIEAGGQVFGMFAQVGSAVLLEVLGHAGFDFVVIDCQHGATSPFGPELADQIRACEAAGMAPLVRPASGDRGQLLRALDLGAKGVVVPQVSTAAMARDAVSAARHPPAGSRSACPAVRGAAFGARPWDEYYRAAREDTLVFMLIEDATGVACVDEIAAVEGVSGLFFGPFDLALATGNDPVGDGVDAHRAVVYRAAARHELLIGDFPWDAESTAELAGRGAHVLAIGMDVTLFGSAARELASRVRGIPRG